MSTMASALIWLALAPFGHCQESTTYTTSSSYYPTATTTSLYATLESIALPTIPFTGQALLVGTCNLPQYTMLYFPDGGILQVPLIGCSDERPDCCPSLNLTQAGATATGAGDTEQDHEGDTTSWTGATSSPAPTGVVSLLSQAPLTVCPSDMVDLDPVCCPIGFAHYGQSIIGNLPCVSTLTSTVFSVPSSVLASITSEVAASLATTTASETPTVSVVINQVFALGLPCADEEPAKGSGGLSTAAKAGIGAGVGVAALLTITFFAWLCLRRRKHNRVAGKNNVGGNASAPAMTSTAYQHNIQSADGTMDPKHVSAVSTMPPASPPLAQGQPQGMYPQMQPYPGMHYQMPMQPGMQGYGYPQNFSSPFGYVPAQQHMQHYSQGYPPGAYPSYIAGSPPPPFYNSGPGREMKPVEVDGGMVLPAQRVNSAGASVSTETPNLRQSARGDGSVAEMGSDSVQRASTT